MSSGKNKLPGVLLLLLSALGIFFGLLTASLIGAGLLGKLPNFLETVELLPAATTGGLALMVSLLNLPAFILAIHSLRAKSTMPRRASLFKSASLAGLAWLAVIAGGLLASREQAPWQILAPLTLLAVALPVWWLVEFSRHGLPRSTALREWGVLSIGLVASPPLILLIEVMLLLVVVLAVIVALGMQPAMLKQVGELTLGLDQYQGGLEELEQILMGLTRNPIIAGGLFLMVGVLAPFIEELFKPMALWFLLKRPLKDCEGFSLGLISGAAFALLESAGLLAQINAESWVLAVVLRACTGVLHVGLSGLAGYGLVFSWNRRRYGHAVLYIFGSAGLHGAWNSLALLSGLAVNNAPDTGFAEFQPTLGGVLAVVGMAAVFIAIPIIVLRINKRLRLAEIEMQTSAVVNEGIAE